MGVAEPGELKPGPYDEARPFEARSAPRMLPQTYPGEWPPDSVVVEASRMWKITDRDGAALAWEDTPPVRVGVCRVRNVLAADRQDASAIQLSRLAEKTRCTPMDARVPVIAVGSNASPAQLRFKFRDRPEILFIPSIRARVHGVAVGYMSKVSQFDYIAATPFPDPDAKPVLAVQFLDDRQLAELDASESPHYRRVWLDSAHGVRIVLETGEELAGAYAYVAADGLLADREGIPIRMRIPGSDGPGLDQAELLASLNDDPDIDPAGNAEDLSPADLTAAIASSGRVVAENAFFDLTDEMGTPPRRYGTLPPVGDLDDTRALAPEKFTGETLAWVDSSPDGLDRGGKSVIRLNREDLRALGGPTVVSIRSARLAAQHGAAAPAALAAVHPYDPLDPPEPDVGHAQVDHVLRMACGVERGDVLAITPAEVERVRWFDPILGKPTYLTMRVTLADPASAERDVVLMSRLAIDILGLESGDYVVMEGAPDEDGEVRSVILKVFEVPSDVEDNRRSVTGGSWGARFPSGTETLGIHQDLPMAFIDAELRARLGVQRQTLATVRARPGRLQRFYAELREILLVLAVALLGVVTVVQNAPVQIALIIGLMVLSTMLVFGRMRRRLSHRTKSRQFRRARKRQRR
ncbi:hypothetical protein [Gordonia crocea]|uniref:Uncharacterized protein n=1 Tax=Gordonia crocea TaxID=589162 RepID=A0A7M3SVI8_9ACTN|nr:hypothetical protein [Gordonia crocea]GED96662.1 hypothetical protein nbrc107697_07010 [Gordonia crocea]